MIRRRLKLYTYHTFLVIPFIVLFLFAHNIKLTRVDMVYRTLLVGTALCVSLYFLTQLIYKNRLKTGVFVTFLLFGLFQYGVYYEFIESLFINGFWPFKNVHRYLIGIYLFGFVTLFIFVKKTKHDFIRINYFLNFLVFILIGFNLFLILTYNPGKSKEKKQSVTFDQKNIQFNSNQTLPDIYYIILDGYASELTLKKYYQFDNSVFLDSLKKQGFKVCDSAFANYYNTTRSLAATLNLDYLTEPNSAHDQISNNHLFNLLRQNKYRTYQLESGYVVTGSFKNMDSIITIDGPNEFEKSLFIHTILRLDDLFGFFTVQRLQSQFEKMHELAELSASPKFCFLHVVAPHPPFVFERNGATRKKHLNDESLWEPTENYVDQLVYVNSRIEKFIKEVVTKNPNAIILLQSDHGPFAAAKTAQEVFESRSSILYAYKGPESLRIPNKTSSVNTFRYVLNNIFSSKLPLLKDEYAGVKILLTHPVFMKKIHR